MVDTRCMVCSNTQCRGGGELTPLGIPGSCCLKDSWPGATSVLMEGASVWQGLVHNKAVSGRGHHYKPQASWIQPQGFPAGPCVCQEHRVMALDIWVDLKGPFRNTDTVPLL